MKSTNKLLLGLVSLFTILFAMGLVSSADVNGSMIMISPVDGNAYSGTFLINITNTTFLEDMLNCTFFINSTITANTSVIVYSNATSPEIVNDSDSDLTINVTFASTEVEDYIDYNVSCICRNTSADYSTASAIITIDNTIPQAASSFSPSDGSIDADGSVTFLGTVVGVNTTNCTLVFPAINPGFSSYIMTHTGDTCTYTHSTVSDGSYQWYIDTSDGTNTTTSSTVTINADITTSAGKAAKFVAEGEAVPEGGALLSIIDGIGDPGVIAIGILIIVVIVYFVYKKK